MKNLIYAAILLFTFCLAADSQTNEIPCQKIIITAPERAQPEETFKVSAAFEKDSQNSTAVFNWTIIKNEQLTKIGNANFIEIKANELGNFSPVIVLADAVETKCQNTAMVNIYTVNNFDPIKMDEFGKLPWPDLRARLDNALIQMQMDKEMSLFIIYTYNKKSPVQVKDHLLRVFNYLSGKGKLAKNRIRFLLSEADEEKTIFQPIPQNSGSVPCDDCTLIRGEQFENLIKLFQSRAQNKPSKSK